MSTITQTISPKAKSTKIKSGPHVYPSSGLPLTPPFTVKDLRDCIPAHCFERSYFISFLYLFTDLFLVLVTGTIGYYVIWNNPLQLPLWSLPLCWTAYVIMQGFFLTGLWVLAHECGHRAFSESNLVNDTVGLIVHSALLVPYHAWRISHGSHHSYTGHMEKDEVHLPNTLSDVLPKLPWGIDKVISSILKHVILGWPAYLMWNASSTRSYKERFPGQKINHFSPYSPIFKPEDRHLIILSDIALVIVFGILGYCCYQFGVLPVILLYFLPYLKVNMWLVLITKLQHTDKEIPRYSTDEWDWLKGQLTTMDRSFGFFIDMVLHHIQDTHICHHLFTKIPHYHAQEATEHLKKKLGPYYRRNEDNVFKQTWQVFNECIFVEDQADIYWFKGRDYVPESKKSN